MGKQPLNTLSSRIYYWDFLIQGSWGNCSFRWHQHSYHKGYDFVFFLLLSIYIDIIQVVDWERQSISTSPCTWMFSGILFYAIRLFLLDPCIFMVYFIRLLFIEDPCEKSHGSHDESHESHECVHTPSTPSWIPTSHQWNVVCFRNHHRFLSNRREESV